MYKQKIIKCKSGKKMKAQIHCPVSGCLYFSGSERYFTEKKFLNQHIAKVHAEKKYSCSKCKKSFGLDWWRKHHEKTCGVEWKCDCGGKYTSRESLLTHARRSQHKLPDHVLCGDKMKQGKIPVKTSENMVILVIQPVIQNLTCINPVQPTLQNPRPILPKTSLPVPIMTVTSNSTSVAPQLTPESFVFCHHQPSSGSDGTSNQYHVQDNPDNNVLTQKNPKQFQKTAATQTADKFQYSAKPRESRASQCTRRIPKSLEVGIESTHTQTAESTVRRIKKKKSRRKSVAITTESNMLTDQNLELGQSLWPGFKDFLLQQADSANARAFKNSAGTQTNSNSCSKVLCDSETITDEELFKFDWAEGVKEKDANDSCESPFEMLSDIAVDDSLATLQDGLDHNNLPVLNMFSNNPVTNGTFTSPTDKQDQENNAFQNSSAEKDLAGGDCSMFSVFRNCSKTDLENKVQHPTLSDIHTQTIASTVLEYNLLANMETQTTDDFTLSDLEFSDTETQTPWEDFPNIDDSPLQTDQLSIEIQTDFSSFDPGSNQDPYDFINGMDVQSMIGGGSSSKETVGVNIETQTYDKFSFPQFTNSESQTLDISSFMFASLNT